MEDKELKKGKVNNSEVIPDYDFLFNGDEESDSKRAKKKLFWKLLKQNKWPLLLGCLIYFIQDSPVWVIPLCTSNIVNKATELLASGNATFSAILPTILISFGIALAFLIINIPATIIRFRIISKMQRNMSAGVKCSVVRKLQSLSITYSKDMQTGKVQSKFLKDTENVENFLHIINFNVIPAILSVIMATVIAIVKSGYIALFFLVIIPLNISVSLFFRKKLSKVFREYRVKTESMSMKLTSMLDMYVITKSHGLEKTEYKEINQSIKDLRGSGMEVDKLNAKFGSTNFVVNNIFSIICLVVCSIFAVIGKIKIGDIILYQSMFTSISSYATMITNGLPTIASGKESLYSISEIMNVKDVEVDSGKGDIKSIEGAIEFKNVSYKYPNSLDYVVKDFNLKVNPGDCVAFVGSSGSGKSTIMNLITGLLVPTKGDILVDGKSIKEYNLSEYRHHLSVVPQNSILFSGTIKENITYGLDRFNEEDFNKSLSLADVNEFLDELPNGVNTIIGEKGDKLSGGQKQRITIARALIRKPKILILDEATSALDNISEYHVQKAINSSIKGRTTFIVAHRLSTIRDANKIVVMENGFAVETGSYNELMEKKGKFFELKSLNEINLQIANNELEEK